MIEQEVVITTEDGEMNTFVICPDEGENFPVVILLMDAMGKREELHDMARRIATTGYYVLVPNLYYRRTKELVIDWGSSDKDHENAMQVIFDHINSLSNSMVVEDCRALIDFADQNTITNKGSVGVLGYSMGGGFAFSVASSIPERVKAIASIFGFKLLTNACDSPHLNANKIEGEIYFACAEQDEYVPQSEINELAVHLKNTPTKSRIEWYEGTAHRFTFVSAENDFNKLATEKHWQRVFSLLKRNL